jgi:hypothetical protein
MRRLAGIHVRSLTAWCVGLGLLLGAPHAVLAQVGASIAGVVRDASGALLPGVTVEVGSPSLIEKVRTTVTDGSGYYLIEQLRPGAYSVTFTLAGFNVLRRDGIELMGSFAATVNAELTLSAVSETVIVSGAAAVVDLRSAARQQVMDAEVLDSAPTARTMVTAAVLIPGVTLTTPDVGGTNALPGGGGQLSIHGGQSQDYRQLVDGVSMANGVSAGAFSQLVPNMAGAEELTINLASGTAEQGTGGIVVNMIPREGGNTFSGLVFATGANDSFQGSNYTEELQARGLRTPTSIKSMYDFNPAFGGPLKRDSLWFFVAARWVRTSNYLGGGLFYNRNAGDPNSWTYESDPARPAYNDTEARGVNGRLTWQVSPKNKLSLFHDNQTRCMCPGHLFGLTSPEAADTLNYPINEITTAAWTSPLTNRMLVEMRTGLRRERFHFARPDTLRLTNVIEQGGAIPGLNYRGGGLASGTQPFASAFNVNWSLLGSLSYITSGHRIKVGFNNQYIQYDQAYNDNDAHVTYRMLNGVPNQLTQRATPYTHSTRRPWELGVYVQDQWTIDRLTLNGGLRFEYLESYFPAQHLGPAALVPSRNLSFPKVGLAGWKDVVPRAAAVYDLSGTGKTAVRVSLNKYVSFQTAVPGFFGAGGPDPISGLALVVTRTWIDGNRNFLPDCDLTNPLTQDQQALGGDLCGVVSNTNFGMPTPSTTANPELFYGWGKRPFQWEFSTSVEHELLPGLSASVGYFRRSFGNLTATDNRALSASDFSPFSIAVPPDPRLPAGGGQLIDGFLDRNPNTLSRPSDNLLTFASEYGDHVQQWNGVDVTMNGRLANIVVQGGVSTGRMLTDNCEVLAALPEMSPLGRPFCRVVQPFLTQVKFLGSYLIPKADVQVSATFQSVPGPALAANQVVPNSAIAPSLGRDLSGGATNATVGLFTPGTEFGDRLNQLDMRFAKILRLGTTRTSLNLDLYNALNVSTVLRENPTYINATLTGWRVPTSIMPARFAKISVQFEF